MSRPGLAPAIVSVALVAVVGRWLPSAAWIPLVGAVAIGVYLFARRAGDPALVAIVVWSFAVRCALALALYAVSAHGLPVLQESHRDHGLWVFGEDGVHYHNLALQILDGWRIGAPMPVGSFEKLTPSLVMALVYRVTGASTLHVIVLNAGLGALSGLLAYRLAARLGDRRRARVAAVLVAWWPSSMLWSTQVLKDPAIHALLLSALLLSVALWQDAVSPPGGVGRGLSSRMASWAGLAATTFGVAAVRAHVGAVLALAVVAIAAPVVVYSLPRRSVAAVVAAASLVVVVCGATLAGVSIDLLSLVSRAGSSVSIPAPNPTAIVSEEPAAGGLTETLRTAVSRVSVDAIADMRRTQVAVGGGTPIDTTTFDSLGGLVGYLPRAMLNAYLAPYPWQLMSTRGHTGRLRPLATVEIVLIALLLPAIAAGFWQRRRFTPDAWLVMTFTLGLAVGFGLIVTNGGTLFRARLQFLFPSLILASTALPAWVYRLSLIDGPAAAGAGAE